MSSKRTKPRSIARQLVVLFTLAAVLLLSCGLGTFYWIVVRHAFEEDNVVLADKEDALQTDFERDGIDALREEIEATGASEHAAFLVRVLGPDGTVIDQTPGMNALLPPEIFPSSTSQQTAVPIELHSAGRLFALTTRSVTSNSQVFNLQVAQDRSADEEFEKQFGALFVLMLVCGSIASAVIAVTVTKRGLQPLSEMTHSLERIGPSHFSEKVAPDTWPRELKPLAHAFDQMLDRLQDSFTRLSQFSADLAHELRTPIANILGEAQVALTRPRSSDEYREVVESTVTECEHLSLIVDNLLFLARAEGAEKQTQPAEFDGRAAIEKIAAYYQTIAEDRHIAIRCDGQGKIFADPVLFERALGNLVDNALRFTPESGEIRMSVAAGNKHTEVSVTDNGAGIAAAHLPRVFDRFYRADPSRSSDGTGLGLALVKSIVDLHGGSATVRSELDRGTTFTLNFPSPNRALAS